MRQTRQRRQAGSGTAPAPAGSRAGTRAGVRAGWLLPALVAVALTGLVIVLRAYLTRPFWYDEIWRAHFVSEPIRSFWSELAVANTPSALGWLAVTRASGELFGWESWAGRLRRLLALPAVGAGLVVLVRRFAGPVAAVFAVCWLCLGATFLDLATQLKPYTVEAFAAVAVLLLWTGGPGPGEGRDRVRLLRRTAAGLVALVAVPLVFLVVPLAAAELARGPARWRRAAESLPAVLLVGLHTLVFLGHQSSQRQGSYWDQHFLAGRDPLEMAAFLGRQLHALLTGSPPGIDRFDPSLVHRSVELPGWLPWVLAPAVLAAGVLGVAALARRADGRLVLAALFGAHLLMLAASAIRFWPVGPVRVNQFVVPLLILVVVVGADRAARMLWARLRGLRARPGLSRSPGHGSSDEEPPSGGVPLGHLVPGQRTPSPSGRGSVEPRVLSTVGGPSGSVPFRAELPGSDPSGSGGGEGGGLAGARPHPPLFRLDGAYRVGYRGAGAQAAARARAGAAAALVLLLAVPALAGLALYGSTAGDRLVWERRDRLRGLDLMVDAAIAARRLYQPGDLLVVGGRLARPGWIYAMEASEDGPRRPADLPPPPAGGSASGEAGAEPPRVDRADTVFVTRPGEGSVRAELARRPGTDRLVVFVFDIEQEAMEPELADLSAAGWCAGPSWDFRLTGTLTVYERCGTAAARS